MFSLMADAVSRISATSRESALYDDRVQMLLVNDSRKRYALHYSCCSFTNLAKSIFAIASRLSLVTHAFGFDLRHEAS